MWGWAHEHNKCITEKKFFFYLVHLLHSKDTKTKFIINEIWAPKKQRIYAITWMRLSRHRIAFAKCWKLIHYNLDSCIVCKRISHCGVFNVHRAVAPDSLFWQYLYECKMDLRSIHLANMLRPICIYKIHRGTFNNINNQ